MTDLDLLTFGCVVLFIAIAGAYVAMRERFGYGEGGVGGPRSRALPARSARIPRSRVPAEPGRRETS